MVKKKVKKENQGHVILKSVNPQPSATTTTANDVHHVLPAWVWDFLRLVRLLRTAGVRARIHRNVRTRNPPQLNDGFAAAAAAAAVSPDDAQQAGALPCNKGASRIAAIVNACRPLVLRSDFAGAAASVDAADAGAAAFLAGRWYVWLLGVGGVALLLAVVVVVVAGVVGVVGVVGVEVAAFVCSGSFAGGSGGVRVGVGAGAGGGVV